MTQRARAIFDQYVSSQLNDPVLSSIGLGTHVFNLTSLASQEHVPVFELVDEVGPLLPVLKAVRRNDPDADSSNT